MGFVGEGASRNVIYVSDHTGGPWMCQVLVGSHLDRSGETDTCRLVSWPAESLFFIFFV